MNYYVVEDSELAKRNQSLVFYGSNIAYNAVLSVSFSDEATGEPVTLQEAKDWCRIDVPDDDAIITALITAARIVCENYANLSFIQRTVTAKIINGLGGITLPYGPVIDPITSVTDKDGADITTGYLLDDSKTDTVTVVYDAGYEVLPENLRTAVLNQIAWMYDNRGEARVAGSVSELSKLLLNQVRSV